MGAEFNGRMTQRYQYTVTESKSGSDQEKCLTVDKRKSQEIYVYAIEDQNLTWTFSLGKIQDIVSLNPNS